MPLTIKEFTDRLIASGFFAKDSVKLMEFKEFQKPKNWKNRIEDFVKKLQVDKNE